jgi:hypothetical protein
MRAAAPLPSEPRSTTGRVIRPAVRTLPGDVMSPVPNQAVSRYGTGRSGMIRENGPRTTLPYLLRGLTPPRLPGLSDRVIRSFTKTIVDLQRVMLDHRAGRLHGGEQVGQRFPQPNAAMPDPLGLPHRDVTSCDFGRAPTARGDTLHGLTATRDHDSEGHRLEPAMEDAVPDRGQRACWCSRLTLTTGPETPVRTKHAPGTSTHPKRPESTPGRKARKVPRDADTWTRTGTPRSEYCQCHNLARTHH